MELEIATSEVAALLDLAGYSPVVVTERLRFLGDLARGDLLTRAQRRLRSTAADYVRLIQPLQATGPIHRPVLWLDVGTAAEKGISRFIFLLEHGAGPWDLRDTILKDGTRRLHRSAAGYLFVYVPFRHMGPNATGFNAPPVGSQFTQATLGPQSRAYHGQLDAAKARALGRKVWNAAMGTKSKPGLAPTLTAPGGGMTRWGGRLPEGMAPILRPRHATDIFAGAVREQKTYQVATQGQMMTWRTISENPMSFRADAGGMNWTHPGLTARRLVPETEGYLQTLLAEGIFEE